MKISIRAFPTAGAAIVMACWSSGPSPASAQATATVSDATYNYNLNIADGTAASGRRSGRGDASKLEDGALNDRLPVASNPSDVMTVFLSTQPYLGLRTDQTAYGVGTYQKFVPHAFGEVELVYVFDVITPTGVKGETVPIVIQGNFDYSWSLSSSVANQPIYGEPFLHLNYFSSAVGTQKVVDINEKVCQQDPCYASSYNASGATLPMQSFSFQTTAVFSSYNSIDMDVYLNAAGVGYMSLALDPYISIDPVFAATHPGYSVKVSPNIGNAPTGDQPASSVPEQATWAMMIAGFGVAGGAMRRRKPFGARAIA